MRYMTVDQTNIAQEHICCAISDKKCAESYELKKEWLRNEFKRALFSAESMNEQKCLLYMGRQNNHGCL